MATLSALGIVRLRYYDTRDGRERALRVISTYSYRFLDSAQMI